MLKHIMLIKLLAMSSHLIESHNYMPNNFEDAILPNAESTDYGSNVSGGVLYIS